MEAARIEATTTNKIIKVVPMEAMITQKRAYRIAAGRAGLVLPRRSRRSPYIDLTYHESVPQSQTSGGPARRLFQVSRCFRACRDCRGIPVASEGEYGRRGPLDSRCRRVPPRDDQDAGRCPS